MSSNSSIGDRGPRRDWGKERFWRKALAEQQRSGQDIRAFCRGRGLSEPGFYAWRRAIAQRDRERAGESVPAFLPVTVRTPPAEREAGCIVIRLRGGRAMRLPAAMDVQRVAELVHAIEGQPYATKGAS